jgi:hypothetical protein
MKFLYRLFLRVARATLSFYDNYYRNDRDFPHKYDNWTKKRQISMFVEMSGNTTFAKNYCGLLILLKISGIWIEWRQNQFQDKKKHPE